MLIFILLVFLRLDFLHAKAVEEKARVSHLQKEIIINENKSLKKNA